MTNAQLRSVEEHAIDACRRVADADAALKMALSARADAIRQLAVAGMTVRAIGDIVGLTHSRVALILRSL